MRPGGDVVGQRPCKDIENASQRALPDHGTPISFFIASEDMVETASSDSINELNESSFGVQSLQETVCSEELGDDKTDSHSHDHGNHEGRRRSTLKSVARTQENSSESNDIMLHHQTKDTVAPRSTLGYASPPSVSESLKSVSQNSQLQGPSLPDSPKSSSTNSFRPFDEESLDETGSQAIISSGEDDIDLPSEIQDSSPQLIMPSIKMPSRRPFTQRGKEMGRLKIMIAGDSGIGKTSLIKSIVQTCEDIVHVDPLTPNLPSFEKILSRKSSSKRDKLNAISTEHITEVYASTKAYPPWWSDIEESKVPRRRKSMGDSVLERNLCFVDTPGYSHNKSPTESIDLVIRYLTDQIKKTHSFANIGNGDLIGLLSGNGGTQVDVVFYLIANEVKSADLDFMRRLSALTNVIPLIAKADLMPPENAQIFKSSITSELQSADVRTFLFSLDEPTISPPFTTCSKSSSDDENMDASLLMSPDYVQPLIPSELIALVHQVFDKENISWLRYLAAKKLVYSQRESEFTTLPPHLSDSSNSAKNTFLTSPVSPIVSPYSSQAIVSYSSNASSYLQAKLADHTQREEKLAQIRLAKWAGDLQRCLHNERARYEAISRGERAVWLTQRLGECVDDGSLVPVRGLSINEHCAKEKTSTKTRLMDTSINHSYKNPQDPLGLLKWNEAIRKRGLVAFQVVGGFGVLGAIAVWIARSWSNGNDAYMAWAWGRWPPGKV